MTCLNWSPQPFTTHCTTAVDLWAQLLVWRAICCSAIGAGSLLPSSFASNILLVPEYYSLSTADVSNRTCWAPVVRIFGTILAFGVDYRPLVWFQLSSALFSAPGWCDAKCWASRLPSPSSCLIPQVASFSEQWFGKFCLCSSINMTYMFFMTVKNKAIGICYCLKMRV